MLLRDEEGEKWMTQIDHLMLSKALARGHHQFAELAVVLIFSLCSCDKTLSERTKKKTGGGLFGFITAHFITVGSRDLSPAGGRN